MLFKKNGLLSILLKHFGGSRGAKRHVRQNLIFYIFLSGFYNFATSDYLKFIEYGLFPMVIDMLNKNITMKRQQAGKLQRCGRFMWRSTSGLGKFANFDN